MRRTLLFAAVVWTAAAAADGGPEAAAGYAAHPRAATLLEMLRAEYGFAEPELAAVTAALRDAAPVPRLIQAEQNAKERVLTWDAYRPIHVNERNVRNGLRFLEQHRRWLARAEAEFGVPPAVIAGILGVETKFGSYATPHRVLDALATQGFDHPTRAEFFLRELAEFFALCREAGFKPTEVRGSYAGALGTAQFMPSNYRRLALDFDGDGVRDLWAAPDAIGSVAHYLVRYAPARRWQRGQPLIVPAEARRQPRATWPRNTREVTHTAGDFERVGLRATVPLPGMTPVGLLALALPDEAQEYWLGLNNFYAVMSYNPRVYYAMAVAQLAEALERQAP